MINVEVIHCGCVHVRAHIHVHVSVRISVRIHICSFLDIIATSIGVIHGIHHASYVRSGCGVVVGDAVDVGIVVIRRIHAVHVRNDCGRFKATAQKICDRSVIIDSSRGSLIAVITVL